MCAENMPDFRPNELRGRLTKLSIKTKDVNKNFIRQVDLKVKN